jgi:geranylgeranyl pyrophosphate synthase
MIFDERIPAVNEPMLFELESLKRKINILLMKHFNNQKIEHSLWAQRLAYPMMVGGKRIRGLLLYTIGQLLGCSLPALEDLCCCIELVHAYSLVHDDLPSMDDDSFRRGYPTVHKIFGEADAILVGDALLTEGFAVLSYSKHIPPLAKISLMQSLSTVLSSKELIMGQWLDIHDVATTLESLITLHQKKTGALFSFALSAPALLQQQNTLADKLKSIGLKLGLAFQIQDDLLDLKEICVTGKTKGKDQKQKKTTFLSLLGKEKSQKMLDQLYQEIAISINEWIPHSQIFTKLLKQIKERDF